MDSTERHGEGGPRARALIVYSAAGTRTVPLPDRGVVELGRREPASVVIEDASLSRLHARFIVDDERIVVEDAGSTNGVHVRGQRVDRAVLTDGMEVRLGSVLVLVRDPATALWVTAGMDGFDAFVERVEEELARGRLLGRTLSLLYVTADAGAVDIASRVEPALRPVDRLGLYAKNVVLALLPETSAAVAAQLSKTLSAKGLGVGFASAHGGTAEDLVARAQANAAGLDAARGAAEPSGEAAVFASTVMHDLVAQLRRVATSQLTVLLRGETGSGKDVLARLVHEASGRSGAFRPINCGAISPALLESTLFGHEKGAFTGADRAMPGLFEQAQGGTVFLDEVGELSPSAQAALLRVLETRTVQRLGSDRDVPVDVRVIAATHKDLLAGAATGTFREDLFYRLDGFGVVVPPLRDRTDDLDALIEHFVREGNRRHRRQLRGVTPLAREVLGAYAFPGNVRELRNAIERAVVVAEGEHVDVQHLPERVRAAARGPDAPSIAPPSPSGPIDLRGRVRAYESDLIRRALDQAGGNRARAAESLGLPVRSLFYKLKELGITARGE
jgi:two-component system, NtrC family, response regulator AtoC